MRVIFFVTLFIAIPLCNVLRCFNKSDQSIINEAVSAMVSPSKTAAVQYSVPSNENLLNKRTIEVILITCSAICVSDGSRVFRFARKYPLAYSCCS